MPGLTIYVSDRDQRRIWAADESPITEVIGALIRWFADNPSGVRQQDAVRLGRALAEQPQRVP